MTLRIGIILSLLTASAFRQGAAFSEPDYAERAELAAMPPPEG